MNTGQPETQKSTGPMPVVSSEMIPLAESTAFAAEEFKLRDHLLLEHRLLVRRIAGSIAQRLPQHLELEELISAGLVGLTEAAFRFDPSRHVDFKSYASFRIRGAIMDSLRTMDWGTRAMRRQSRQMEETSISLLARLGRVPNQEEIADGMGLALDEYQRFCGDVAGLALRSLDDDTPKDQGYEGPWESAVPVSQDPNPLALCLQYESRERLVAAIEELPEKERIVIALYYHEELTMKEISKVLRVVPSRVTQIHTRALTRLRCSLTESV